MNLESNQLSLEQEFTHQVFAKKIKDLSDEEIRELPIEFHKQMLFKDNFDRQIFCRDKKIVNHLWDN